jgi:hypothetical protein
MDVTDEHLAAIRRVFADKAAWLARMAEIQAKRDQELQDLAKKVSKAMIKQDAGLIDPVNLDRSAESPTAEIDADPAVHADEPLNEQVQEEYEEQQASDYASDNPPPVYHGTPSAIRCALRCHVLVFARLASVDKSAMAGARKVALVLKRKKKKNFLKNLSFLHMKELLSGHGLEECEAQQVGGCASEVKMELALE